MQPIGIRGVVVGLVAGVVSVLPCAGLRSEGLDERDYELRAGSFIVDGCRDCDRPTFEVPIAGTFRLRVVNYGNVITQYEILDLDLRTAAAEYEILGSGTYNTWLGEPGTQAMKLDLQVNGQAGVQLESGIVEHLVPYWTAWLAIDVAVTEGGDRDPFHVYTLRLVAAPVARMVRYALQEGSSLVDDCIDCGRPALLVPIEGAFLLGEIDGGPNPIVTYRVDAVDFRSTPAAGAEVRVTGIGIYRQGGEVALVQEMQLTVQVNDLPASVLESTDPVVRVPLPAIDIELHQKDPPGSTVYSLHIVAMPSENAVSIPFRRGEVNADGDVDISDAIALLVWLFASGSAPGCLEATDANDDGGVDVSDAVSVLLFLFQGGRPPPAPGPEACGTVPEPHLGCEAYPDCPGA